jgi:hypothetical protein
MKKNLLKKIENENLNWTSSKCHLTCDALTITTGEVMLTF